MKCSCCKYIKTYTKTKNKSSKNTICKQITTLYHLQLSGIVVYVYMAGNTMRSHMACEFLYWCDRLDCKLCILYFTFIKQTIPRLYMTKIKVQI